MTTRATAPFGAPCWIDLWTPDADASRRFYSELFGWEAAAPAPEFGGYFMFLREGVPVAGGMGPMGDLAPDNRWRPYFAVSDVAATTAAAEARGAGVGAAPIPVADLGVQAVLSDPAGSTFGLWQPMRFPGFTVLEEPGSPSWVELHTKDYDRVVGFYTETLRWSTEAIADGPEFRYRSVRDADREGFVAGVLDATGQATSGWYVYWGTEDVDGTAERALKLGATTVHEPHDSPYGRLSWLADPLGAPFNLRQP